MIRFYAPSDLHGHYSNFSRHRVTIFGHTWPTSEHAFQAAKFMPHRSDLVEAVLAAPSPGKAAEIGRNRAYPLHPLWEKNVAKMLLVIDDICKLPQFIDDGVHRPGVKPYRVLEVWKDKVMYEVVFAKFFQNHNLQSRLLETGEQPLVEDAIHDPYWGWGASHVGLNKLGQILMLVRYALRNRIGIPGSAMNLHEDGTLVEEDPYFGGAFLA